MTTIVANLESIGCDRKFARETGQFFKGTTKIYEIPEEFAKATFECDKAFIGFAGVAETMFEYREFMADWTKAKPTRWRKEISALVLTADKRLFGSDTGSKYYEIREPYYAVGTGAMFALGALKQGASLKEALKVAADCDVYTGCGFKFYSF